MFHGGLLTTRRSSAATHIPNSAKRYGTRQSRQLANQPAIRQTKVEAAAATRTTYAAA